MTDLELDNTIVGKAFLNSSRYPSVDAFLDWRLKLKEYISRFPEYQDSLNKELMAVDEILKRLTT